MSPLLLVVSLDEGAIPSASTIAVNGDSSLHGAVPVFVGLLTRCGESARIRRWTNGTSRKF